MIFWVVVGVVVGRVYSRARSGCEVGVIAYAVLFLGLLELPRFTYWTLGRFFPAIVAMILMMGYDRAISRRPGRVSHEIPHVREPREIRKKEPAGIGGEAE